MSLFFKEFTELNKVSYLCSVDGIRLVKVQPPKDKNSKAVFLLEALSEDYINLYEGKWDNPSKFGNPYVENARKLLFKRKELANKAINIIK